MNKHTRNGVDRRQSSSAGFTIIETIIVLGIAGLILAIVLEALPALTRNSHNNQRAQDVSLILQSVSHYELNNSGNYPSDCGAAPACDATSFLGGSYRNLTFYTNSQLTLGHGSPTTRPTRANPNNGANAYIYNYQKCDPSGNGNGTAVGAGYNDVVALYALETRGGTQPKCQQL